jgi:hypothetical protein
MKYCSFYITLTIYGAWIDKRSQTSMTVGAIILLEDESCSAEYAFTILYHPSYENMEQIFHSLNPYSGCPPTTFDT